MKTCFLVPPSLILGGKVLLNFGDSFNALGLNKLSQKSYLDKCAISDGLNRYRAAKCFLRFKKQLLLAMCFRKTSDKRYNVSYCGNLQ